MKKVIILLILLCLFGIDAKSDDQFYDYCIVVTKLKIISDIDGDRIVPDIPCRIFSYVAVQSGRDVTYSKDLKLEGKEIMACVAVKHEDRAKIEHLIIGDKFKDVKSKADYSKHYPFKIKDIKRKYDDKTGDPIEYLGADKDDPARFAMWDD